MYLCLAALLLTACNAKQAKQNVQETTAQDASQQVTPAAEGSEAPDFTLKDSNGNDFTLSSLRGKYVVLDFWGTWCKYCVMGIPQMKEYYDKYEGKFEMVSIDFNDSEDTWLKAIDEYGMNWIHVCTDEESAPELQELYQIEGFPTKIVISPEGKILHITIGEDPAFYTYLDEQFG